MLLVCFLAQYLHQIKQLDFLLVVLGHGAPPMVKIYRFIIAQDTKKVNICAV